MKRYCTFILAIALALFLAACSSNNDLATVPLEPQFGSADSEIGYDVAAAPSGHTYVLSYHTGPVQQDSNDYYQTIKLQRYNAAGSLMWSRDIANVPNDGNGGIDYYIGLSPISVSTDAYGNAYALTAEYSMDYDAYNTVYSNFSVVKYSPTGTLLASVGISSGRGDNVNGYSDTVGTFAVDRYGAIFAGNSDCNYSDCAYLISKYSSQDGELRWQRPSTVGVPHSITVISAGSVYVVGSEGMAHYNSAGRLFWTKKGSSHAVSLLSKIVASGSNLYVRDNNTIRKYNANGNLLWNRVQGGLNSLVLVNMTADANGNVYLAGRFRPGSSSDYNAFIRKLNGQGRTLWTKTFGTYHFDEARGIATLNGNTIYVTGTTRGSLAHPNRGDSDGFLRKHNSQGNRLWTR